MSVICETRETAAVIRLEVAVFKKHEMVEILNTENEIYGGCNILNDGVLKTTQFEDYKERKKNIKNPKEKVFPYYFNIKLPRYGTCIFKIKK